MSFLQRIRDANRYRLGGFVPFEIQGHRYGWVRHGLARRLQDWPSVFALRDGVLRLTPELDAPDTPCEQRSREVEAVCLDLREAGIISGWRGERYPVCRHWGDPPVLLLERATVTFFGVTAYGVHMNGYVRGEDGAPRMWVATRAKSKPTGAGKLDQMVAGGQPHGISLVDNMIKECAEEAAIPPAIARGVRSVGAVSYVLETESGLRPDVLFNFDLELPAQFEPVNTDGEVDAFQLMDMSELQEVVEHSERFKFNCALVVIDFMIRHGIIDADHPDYEAMVLELRPGVAPARLAG